MGLKQLVKKTSKKDMPTFDPFPPGFQYAGHYSYCYVFVHPGYSKYRGIAEHHKTDKYGQYNGCLENIKQFIKHLKTIGELTIFAIEDEIFRNKIQNDKDLSPLESSLIMISKGPFE